MDNNTYLCGYTEYEDYREFPKIVIEATADFTDGSIIRLTYFSWNDFFIKRELTEPKLDYKFENITREYFISLMKSWHPSIKFIENKENN